MELLCEFNRNRSITIVMVTRRAGYGPVCRKNCSIHGRRHSKSGLDQGRIMVWNSLVLALREIRRNAMRSLLTMLGIVIGVAAVIAMVTIGGGAGQSLGRYRKAGKQSAGDPDRAAPRSGGSSASASPCDARTFRPFPVKSPIWPQSPRRHPAPARSYSEIRTGPPR